MKKHIYLLLPLLTLHPTLATQKVVNSLIIASTLALSPTTQQPTLDTQPPRNLHDLDEKHILNLILNNYLRKAKLNKHLPNELQRLIHTFFIHEWTIHGLHKETGTTYDPHDFDISGIHKQTQTHLNPRGFTQNGDYKDLDPTTGKSTQYDPQGYNIDRWNKDGLHENGTKLNNQGFPQHVNYASIHLHTAIDNLDKQALTLLLKNPNINVNSPTNKGTTPLIMCCKIGDGALQIAQALLGHKEINVNLQDNNVGFTPLIMCAYSGDKSLHIAQELLKHKHINVNLQNKDGWTPLIRCCKTGDDALHIAQELLKHQHINVNLQNNNGWTPLIECAWKGDGALHIAQELLKHQHINVNLQNKDGWTPLIMCCKTGDDALPIAQELLKHQHINVNLQNNNGWTPLIECAWKGDDALHIAQALLKHQHINVNLQDNDGRTPLIECAWKGDDTLQIAQELLKHQHININLQEKNGWTPLMMCCQKGQKSLKIAQALLKHKHINVNLQDKLGWTPLIRCCWKGDKSLQIAQALLKRKDINVNLQTNKGETPLDSIIYWIKQNKENYKYVQLWNHLVAEGGILNKRTTDYQNLNPNHFQEPQKSHVQAIKNNPPINIRFPHIYQKHNQLRKQLEKLQKTSTEQLDQKNNTISDLKDQTQRLNNWITTAKQHIYKQQKTIQQQNETIKNHLKKISSLQEYSDNLKDHTKKPLTDYTDSKKTSKKQEMS